MSAASGPRRGDLRIGRRRAFGITVAALLGIVLVPTVVTEPASVGFPVNDKLLSHRAVVDGAGRLLAWYSPHRGRGYDRVLRTGWQFIERQVPGDRRWGTRLPVYLIDSVFDGRTRQGSYWQHNPASLYGQFVDAVVAWYPYSGDTDAVRVVRGMLDYQLAHGTTPSTWEWPRVPFATACGGDRDYGRCMAGMPRRFYGGIETDKVGELGIGYAKFYELTGERRFLAAAVAAADALASHVRAGDAWHTPWPFRVDAQTGAVLAKEQYGGMIVAPVRLFDELIRLGEGNVGQYKRARDEAWGWILRYPLNKRSWAYRKWTGYFEDQPRNLANLNQAAPTMTAWYLLTHPAPATIDPNWKRHAGELIEWVRRYFGQGPYHGAWAIDEQHPPGGRLCCSSAGLGSATSRWAALNALFAERTGDRAAFRRAFRSLNYATYFSARDGKVACCGRDFSNPYWFDDGYADYLRNFSWAMGALPQLAPQGEDHVLSSSSVIQTVGYGRGQVAYRAHDDSGTEVLRLSFMPATVTGDGRALSRRVALDGPGYTVRPLAGGDFVVQIRREGASAVAVSG